MTDAVITKEYELAYFLDSAVSGEIEPENLKVQSAIVESGGVTHKGLPPEKKRLSYPLKKRSEAHFGLIHFSAEPEEIAKIKKALALNKKVLRFLILNREQSPLPPAPLSPAAEPKPQEAESRAVPVQKVPESFAKKLEKILKG